MRFILDNSVCMRWLFGDGSPGDQQYAAHVLQSITSSSVLVPSVWGLEVANVISRAEKKFGLTKSRSAQFLLLLKQLHIQIDEKTHHYAMNDILQLARRYGLSAYDAAYLELALREGLPIATLDASMQKAAKKAGVNRF